MQDFPRGVPFVIPGLCSQEAITILKADVQVWAMLSNSNHITYPMSEMLKIENMCMYMYAQLSVKKKKKDGNFFLLLKHF